MPGVKVVEEENVPETVAVQKTMEAMIKQDRRHAAVPDLVRLLRSAHAEGGGEVSRTCASTHCGGLWTEGKHPKNIGSYFGYIDECQYLSGIVAGHTTKTKKLGFVAAKPIPQVLRNINAFTLGARSVDPTITRSVIFTGDWSMPVKEAEATDQPDRPGRATCSPATSTARRSSSRRRRSAASSCSGYHVSQAVLAPKGYLTGAEWDWATPYSDPGRSRPRPARRCRTSCAAA